MRGGPRHPEQSAGGYQQLAGETAGPRLFMESGVNIGLLGTKGRAGQTRQNDAWWC